MMIQRQKLYQSPSNYNACNTQLSSRPWKFQEEIISMPDNRLRDENNELLQSTCKRSYDQSLNP